MRPGEARGACISGAGATAVRGLGRSLVLLVARAAMTALAALGRSLVLLAPNEDTYVDFLAVRKVPVRAVPPDPAAADVMEAAAEAVRGDLDLHDKGQRAMVSFVRAYKEHHCNYIFQLDKAAPPRAALTHPTRQTQQDVGSAAGHTHPPDGARSCGLQPKRHRSSSNGRGRSDTCGRPCHGRRA